MKCGARVAAAMAGGYVLGRTKKMKLALAIGGWAAGRRLGTNPAEILGKGTELIRSSPEFAKLDEQLRGRLLEAGKAAVIAAATNRLSSLTDSIGDSAERLAAGGPLRERRPAADTAAGAAAGDEPAEDGDGRDRDGDTAAEQGAGEAANGDEAPARPRRRRPAGADAPTRSSATATGTARRAGTATTRRATASATGRSTAGEGSRAGRARSAAGGRAGGRSTRTRRGGDDG